MVFSSTVFLFLFLPAVLFIYYNPFFKSQTFRNVTLLLASLGFYAWGEPVFVFLMLFSLLLTFILGIWIEDSRQGKKKTGILAFGIGFHILLLAIFKYLPFLLSQLGLLLQNESLKLSISMPIGISFFTFQMMSYLFDIYYQKAKAQRSILHAGLYITFFPQLIAGPIVRYDQIAGQLKERQAGEADLAWGMWRFITGLGKKALLANHLALVADNVFDVYAAESCSVTTAWLGAAAYMLQIYFDFSGYSDMAIGLGRMFGFTFPENFNYPYMAKSVTDFWKRWHISLSSWFRDYVYIPLGGNRVAKRRWVKNLLAVWLLTGIWHGANWTFLLWGIFYFSLLLLEKTTGFTEKLGVFSHLYTLLAVCLAWVIFRAESIPAAFRYIGLLFGVGAKSFLDSVSLNYLQNGGALFAASLLFAIPVLPWIRKRYGEAPWYQIAAPMGCLAIFTLSLLSVIGESYNPFIYFNF